MGNTEGTDTENSTDNTSVKKSSQSVASANLHAPVPDSERILTKEQMVELLSEVSKKANTDSANIKETLDKLTEAVNNLATNSTTKGNNKGTIPLKDDTSRLERAIARVEEAGFEAKQDPGLIGRLMNTFLDGSYDKIIDNLNKQKVEKLKEKNPKAAAVIENKKQEVKKQNDLTTAPVEEVTIKNADSSKLVDKTAIKVEITEINEKVQDDIEELLNRTLSKYFILNQTGSTTITPVPPVGGKGGAEGSGGGAGGGPKEGVPKAGKPPEKNVTPSENVGEGVKKTPQNETETPLRLKSGESPEQLRLPTAERQLLKEPIPAAKEIPTYPIGQKLPVKGEGESIFGRLVKRIEPEEGLEEGLGGKVAGEGMGAVGWAILAATLADQFFPEFNKNINNKLIEYVTNPMRKAVGAAPIPLETTVKTSNEQINTPSKPAVSTTSPLTTPATLPGVPSVPPSINTLQKSSDVSTPAPGYGVYSTSQGPASNIGTATVTSNKETKANDEYMNSVLVKLDSLTTALAQTNKNTGSIITSNVSNSGKTSTSITIQNQNSEEINSSRDRSFGLLVRNRQLLT